MSTIQIKGSHKMVKNFIKKGENISVNDNHNKIFKLYYDYLLSIENKESTIVTKFNYVYLLERYLYSIGKNFKTMTKQNIYDYINECSQIQSWGLFYQDVNKLYIKHFMNWAYKNNFTKISGDMTIPKIVWHLKTNIRTYYTKDEITKLLDAIDVKTIQGKEDYLIMSLICYLGLRISDVVNLRLSNIDFNTNTISIIQYKTNQLLTLPLIDKVKYPLLDYLKNARIANCDIDYIFVSNTKPYKQKTQLTTHNYIVKNYLKKAGIDINGRKHGFHALRHSFSTALLSEDVSLYSISTILGHRQLDTTMLYLDIDTSKLKELALEVPNVK